MGCDATISGLHQWKPCKKQIVGADGSKKHPTDPTGWWSYIGCICGAVATAAQEKEARKAWRDTKETAKWHGETGVQAGMNLD